VETTCKIYPENKYTEMNVNIRVPFCNKQKGSDFDLDRVHKRQEAFAWDLLGSFSKRIISSLERRMRACQENLIRHLDDVEYSDECGHIVYRRKDGSTGTFNVSSFGTMQEAVKCLKQSDWRGYMSNPFYVDQTLKALLNDTEQNHSDEGQLKYSDLVSLLCEIHLMGTQHG
jgi:hypothetical protein